MFGDAYRKTWSRNSRGWRLRCIFIDDDEVHEHWVREMPNKIPRTDEASAVENATPKDSAETENAGSKDSEETGKDKQSSSSNASSNASNRTLKFGEDLQQGRETTCTKCVSEVF